MSEINFRRVVAGFGQGRLAITVPKPLLHHFKKGEVVEVIIREVKEGEN